MARVSSILQYNGTMDTNPNLYLSLQDTLFRVIICLFDNVVSKPMRAVVLGKGFRPPIHLLMGFLTVLRIGLQTPSRQFKLYLFYEILDLQTLPSGSSSSSLFVHTPSLCVFTLFPVFPSFSQFSQPTLLICLPLPYIVTPQWGTNHYCFNSFHASPLLLESRGIIMPSEDSLETCSRCQIAFNSEFPKGTNNSQQLTLFQSLLHQFPTT